jgi:hypothetical protein
VIEESVKFIKDAICVYICCSHVAGK